jgi:DNA modification methylase
VSVFAGDCLDLLRTLPDASVDAVVTDPPYAVTRNAWDCEVPLDVLMPELLRVAKPNAAIVVFAQGVFTARLILSAPEFYRYSWVWDKAGATGHLNAKKQPMRRHEDIAVFYREQPTYNPQMTSGDACHGRGGGSSTTENYGGYSYTETEGAMKYPQSILRVPKVPPGKGTHPTEKPVALLEYLLRTYTNPGDLVLDPFLGSGTTAVAAEALGRRWLGSEIVEEYRQHIERRLATVQGNLFADSTDL